MPHHSPPDLLTRCVSRPGSPLTRLWNAVVDLVAVHEAAYLEHCRRFALKGQRVDELEPSDAGAVAATVL